METMAAAKKDFDVKKSRLKEEAPYSKRIARMRGSLLSSPYEGDIERARYYTKAYKQTEGQPPCIRAARGLEETLRRMSIKIDDDDLLVGAKTIKKIAAPIGIERSAMNRITMMNKASRNAETKTKRIFEAVLSPEYLNGLLGVPDEILNELDGEILPYWKGRTMNDLMESRWEQEGIHAKGDPVPMIASVLAMQAHVAIGLEKVLNIGFKGIHEQAARQLKELKPEDSRYEWRKDFLESVQVAAMAVCDHAERYARLAKEMAEKAEGKRKTELVEIAGRCRRVPAQPAKTFMEALQAIWMTQTVIQISYGEDSAFAPSRVDQYLYPYFERDLKAGLLSEESAIEALEEYLIKLSTFTIAGPNNLTIGGVDAQGKDAVNAISYLMLEAFRRLKGLRNGLAVRISEKTPREFLIKACEVHRRTAGISFYNDEKIVEDLMRDGYSEEDARGYCAVGCVELAGTGNNNGYTAGSGIYFQAILEMALNEGCRYANRWHRVGVKTSPAAAFKTFDDVKNAFAAQLANSVDLMVKMTNSKDQVFAELFPTPLLSSTIEGCIESGHDITRGGARYNHNSVGAQGLATVANSLAGIQWAVFEEKLVTMEELAKHLRNNFAGAEGLRQQLLRKAPKYGNNNPKADEIALWVADLLDKEARKHKRPMDGGTYRALMISAGGQVEAGRMLGATADGRLAGEPLSNGISPSNGTDTRGMTAALQSAAMACKPNLSAGTAMNINLNPFSIRTEEGVDKFASLIEGYFYLGGRQVQFNPMSRQTLKDAQENPGDYPDLIVKVSGYSFRFVDLSKNLQDDIMNRTEYEI